MEIDQTRFHAEATRWAKRYALALPPKTKVEFNPLAKNGTELVGLEVGPQPHPLAEFAGMFKDDPLFEDWQKAIAEYRRQVDNDPNYL